LRVFRSDGSEAGETGKGDAGKAVGAAGQHDIGPPVAQHVESMGDGVVPRGTGCRDHHVGTGEVDLGRHGIGDHVAGIAVRELRADLGQLVGHDAVVVALDLQRLARGGAHRHPAALGIVPFGVYPGIVQGHAGRSHGKAGCAAYLVGGQPGEEVFGSEPVYLGAAVDAVPLRVERLDRRHATVTRQQVLPGLLPADPDRRHHAEAGDHDATGHRSCHLALGLELLQTDQDDLDGVLDGLQFLKLPLGEAQLEGIVDVHADLEVG